MKSTLQLNEPDPRFHGGRLKEPNKLKELSASFFFYLTILFFIIGFNFSDTMLNGWTQQFMPPLNNRPISDITFLDSLTGYAVTGDGTVGDTNFVLKTTNSGDSWTIIYNLYRDFSRIKFINLNTGYVCGGFNASCAMVLKTTNAGLNWNPIITPCVLYFNDMAVLNEDTIWVVGSNSFDGGVYRTTNGGGSWDRQLNLGSSNPAYIYMYNARIGYIAPSTNSGTHYVRKTTNSGINWDTIINGEGFRDIYFVDSLTGWKCNQDMKKTTNGGLNWITQTLPNGGNIVFNYMLKFSNVNNDTIWGVGGVLFVPPSGARGILFRTINGGNNWLFQLPDTAIHSGQYQYVKFIDKLRGWAYWPSGGVHTTTGGNDTFYTHVESVNTIIPAEFKLFQNYPNPFNPSTIIRFQIQRLADVRIIIYDVTGKEMTTLADKEYRAGSYEVTFDGSNYSSGIYFYSLNVDGKLIETKRMILLK